MEGNKQEAKCGFSKRILEMGNGTGVEYETWYTNLSYKNSPEFFYAGLDTHSCTKGWRSSAGVKTYSNWPLCPQLSVKGELVGGLDIAKELKNNGELPPILKGENWMLRGARCCRKYFIPVGLPDSVLRGRRAAETASYPVVLSVFHKFVLNTCMFHFFYHTQNARNIFKSN